MLNKEKNISNLGGPNQFDSFTRDLTQLTTPTSNLFQIFCKLFWLLLMLRVFILAEEDSDDDSSEVIDTPITSTSKLLFSNFHDFHNLMFE